MFAGHFGVAAGVKGKSPDVPLWALMVSTQLLDIVFIPFLLTGVETIEGSGYGGSVIHADYTHSLVGALIIAIVAGLIAGRFWGRKSGIIIGSVVFSHWILDLIVHRADLPILPGNWGNLPLLGFGLWRISALSMTIELLLIIIGGFFYFRSIVSGTEGSNRRLAKITGGIMSILLLLSLLSDIFGFMS
jgi:hypothetical protein